MYRNDPKISVRQVWANCIDPYQTAVWSGSTLFAIFFSLIIGMNFIFVDFIGINSGESLTNLTYRLYVKFVSDSPDFTHR